MKPEQLMTFFQRVLRDRTLVVLLISGIMVLSIADFFIVQTVQREQQYRQRLIAQQLQAQLQSALEEHVTALIALNVVYQNFVDINAYDFQQYGQAIAAHLGGFRRLYFVDPHLVVRQVYPNNAPNKGLVGISLAKNTFLANYFQKAKQRKAPSTTGLFPFLDFPKNLLAVMPVYREGRGFIGYAVGEISLLDIWKPYSNNTLLSKYRVQLLDPRHEVFFSDSKMQEDGPKPSLLPFRLAGEPWTLLLQSTMSPFELLFIQRFWLWGVGLSILFLVIGLMARTQRHKSALGEAQEQFKTIFDASPDGIMLLNNHLKPQLLNPVIKHWTGQPVTALQQKSFFELFTCQCPHLEKCSELSFLLCTSQKFKEELPETLEVKINEPLEGSPSTYRLSASRIRHIVDGQPTDGFICILGDISASKELTQEKETYIATLTHDLKTPLLAQKMVLENILDDTEGNITKRQRSLLYNSAQSVQDLLDIVNGTLVFYQIESSHLRIHKDKVDFAGLVKDVIETLQPLANNREQTFTLETASDLPAVWVDYVQIKRVLHNILSNAVHYAKRRSNIRVTVGLDGSERVLIDVVNEGKGIAAEDLTRIFDKHYSLSRRFKRIGTGLGLYIARRIVELHGGRIWAESEIDKETHFFIALPYPQQVTSSEPLSQASLQALS